MRHNVGVLARLLRNYCTICPIWPVAAGPTAACKAVQSPVPHCKASLASRNVRGGRNCACDPSRSASERPALKSPFCPGLNLLFFVQHTAAITHHIRWLAVIGQHTLGLDRLEAWLRATVFANVHTSQ